MDLLFIIKRQCFPQAPLMNQSNPTSTGYKPGSPSANISEDSPMHSSDDSILVLASKVCQNSKSLTILYSPFQSVCCDSPISDKAASDDNLLAEKVCLLTTEKLPNLIHNILFSLHLNLVKSSWSN